MRIAVCIKQVFDPATIKVSRTRQAIDDRGARKILNPSDRWALDAALRFKEQDPSTEIVAMTIGEGDAEDILREALALGVDRAILLSDPVLDQDDRRGPRQGAGRRHPPPARACNWSSPAAWPWTRAAASWRPRLAIELGDWPVLMDADQLRVEGNHITACSTSRIATTPAAIRCQRWSRSGRHPSTRATRTAPTSSTRTVSRTSRCGAA